MCRQKGDSVCCAWRIYSGLLKGNILVSLFAICISIHEYELYRSTAHNISNVTLVQHANKLRSLIDLLVSFLFFFSFSLSRSLVDSFARLRWKG